MEATQAPPSLEQVFQVLQQATSQDQATLKAAEQIFESYKMVPGFFETVQIIAADRNLPLHIRQMAIIQFKIVVPTQWRRAQLYPVDIKQRIRDRTSVFLDEPDDTVAKANAVAIAKIARIDYPRAWPALDANIIAVIEANFQSVYISQNATPQNLLGLRRSLEALNQVLKELTAAKVPAIATSVLELVNRIHTPLVTVYRQAYTAFTEGLSPATLTSDYTLYHIRIAHVTFKCIAKGVIFLWQRTRVSGFEAVDKVVKEHFAMAVADFQTLSNGRIALFRQGLSEAMIGSQTQLILSRHIHTYGKYFRKMQIFSSARFITLPQSQELVRYYWDIVVQAAAPDSPASNIQDSDEAIYPVKHLTKAMCIFKDSLAQWSPNRQGQEFIPSEFVRNAVNFIVTRLMLLDQNDLEEWSDDPETWVDKEESDSDAWEFGIRPCAERVLITLSTQYGDHVAPMIKDYLEEVKEKPLTDMTSVLQKEAIYCAVGRCAHRLRNHIRFDVWIKNNLEAEARDPQPSSRIIKRRIAWLFGRWFQENLVMESRTKVYGILVTLIQTQGEGSDPVVRLTAATALRDCIDSISFELKDFEPSLEESIVSLLQLLRVTNSLDAKKRVLRTINCVVSAAREKIADYLQFIAEPILTLWQELGDDIPLRSEIIATVTDLVKASDDRSALIAPACVILVQQCLSPKLSAQLDQDALNLCLITLRNSVPNVDTGLFQLLPEVVRLLNDNLDLLGQITQILESYMLLDCSRVLQALPLHQAYLQVYNVALPGNIRQMLSTVSLMVQLSPSSQWAEAMHVSGFFAKLLDSLIEDKAKNENTLTLVEVINVFARMIIRDATVFVQLVAASSRQNKPETYLMNGFLDQWWAKWDNIIDAPRRKLHALAYAELIATGNRDVIERMPSKEPFEIWADVLGELKEAYAIAPGDDQEDSPLIRFWKAQDDFVLPDRLEDAADTVEHERRKQVWEQDVVRTIPLTDFIQQSMQRAQAAAQANGVNFQEALSKVDPTSIESLQKLLVT